MTGMSMTKSVKKWRCSNELWAFVEPRLPEHKNTHRFGGAWSRVDDRRAFHGILFVTRTGCQWNTLNATGICSSSTAHRRCQEWAESDVFKQLWADGLACSDELRRIDWKLQSMDAAMTKAPLRRGKARPQSNGSSKRRRQA